jgi:hypothetical protein
VGPSDDEHDSAGDRPLAPRNRETQKADGVHRKVGATPQKSQPLHHFNFPPTSQKVEDAWPEFSEPGSTRSHSPRRQHQPGSEKVERPPPKPGEAHPSGPGKADSSASQRPHRTNGPIWSSSRILELTTSGAPQEPEQSSGTASSDAPHLSSGRHESIPQCWRSPHGIVWQINLREGRWRFGWTNVGLSQIETGRESVRPMSQSPRI